VFRKIISAIPGFRSGRLWKKIIACIVYPVLIIAIISLIVGSQDPSAQPMDNTISKWENVSLIFFLVLIPFTLLTNIGNIRSNLPLFKSSSRVKKIVAWTLSFVIVFVGMLFTSSTLSSKHSPEYKALQQQLSQEQDIQRAREQEKKEAEKQIELAKEAEETAVKEANKQAKLAKEAEKKAAQASEEKEKKEAEEQAELAKAAEEKAKIEADKQAKLAEQAAEDAISEEPSKQVQAANAKSVSSWFGSLFNKSKATDNNSKTLKSIDSNLKKHNSQKIVEIYNSSSSDDQIKKYIEERINEKYMESLRESKELFLNKKIDKIKKLYKEMDFINDIPNLKNSDAGTVLAETKALIEADTALVSFNKENPNLYYGTIKDISEVENMNGYVNNRIKNSDIKIGDLTIETGSYSENYFISSYSYSELFGYSPSEDWEAVLQLSKNSELSQAGVYKTDVVSIGTTTLIDNRGFKKEYPLYREVSQEDYDKYYRINELMDRQSQLNNSINGSIKRIAEHLS
jgi:chemotaxis protein histidine kinase CheA